MWIRRNVKHTAAKRAGLPPIGVVGPFPGPAHRRRELYPGDDLMAKVLEAATEPRPDTAVANALASAGISAAKPKHLRWSGLWLPNHRRRVIPDAIYNVSGDTPVRQDDVNAGSIWHAIAQGRTPRDGDVFVARRGRVKHRGWALTTRCAPVTSEEVLGEDLPSILLNPSSTWVVFARPEPVADAAVAVFTAGRRVLGDDPTFEFVLRQAMTPYFPKEPPAK